MRSKRITQDEQMKLIQECRASGMTDQEWYEEHGICHKTFYTWIYRMKKKGILDIPAAIPTAISKERRQPEIVKIQVEPRPDDTSSVAVPGSDRAVPSLLASTSGILVMEVTIDGIQLRVTNDINPQMLAQTIRFLRGYGC